MNNIGKIINFFELIHQVVKKHEEIARISGANFNVFEVLNLQTSEVRTHSAFLAEFLNAKGSHGQGNLYLQLFIDQFIVYNFDFDSERSEAFVEYHIDQINKRQTTGGRIDILIEDANKNRIIIENKIYADDQENQLLRYYNFDNNAYLFYLTLQGVDPSKSSTGGKLNKGRMNGNGYECISYNTDIIDWLEKCKKESVSLPVIRETITQYIRLIQRLTGQTSGDKMKEEVTNLLKDNPELVSSIDLCCKTLNELVNTVKKEFYKLGNEELDKNGDTPLKGGDRLRVFLREDGDGVYFGYMVVDDNGNKINDKNRLSEYAKILHDCSDKIHKNNYFIGWWNPAPFDRYQRFEDFEKDKNKIIEMHFDKQKLQDLVDKVIYQENAIRECFINKVSQCECEILKEGN